MRRQLGIAIWLLLSVFGGCGWGRDDDDSGGRSSEGGGGRGSYGSGPGVTQVTLRPACEMRGAVVGDRMLIMGGSSSENVTFGSERAQEETPDEIELAGELSVFDPIERNGDAVIFSPSWSRVYLPDPRRGYAMVTHGNRVYVAGGQRPLNAAQGDEAFDYRMSKSDRVDVYDHDSGGFVSAMALSSGRTGLAAAAAGPYVVFAGGDDGTLGPLGELCGGGSCYYYSSRVDVYDVEQNSWSTTELPRATANIRGASAGDKAVFYVDGSELFIFDSATLGFKSVQTPSAARNRRRLTSAFFVYGGRVYIAGGHAAQYDTYDQLEVFDLESETWEETRLSVTRASLAATGAGGKILIGGGQNQHFSFTGGSLYPDEVDIFDPETGDVASTNLIAGRHKLIALTVADRFAVFAGGLGGATSVDAKGAVTAAVEVYDVESGVWYNGNGTPRSTTPVPEPMPLPPREGHAVLYVPVAAADEVHAFDVDDKSGALTLIGRYATGRKPVAVAWDYGSKEFLYVSNRGSGNVSAYRIASDGTLAEIPGSPFAVRAEPQGVLVTTRVRHLYDTAHTSTLYVASSGSGTISAYEIDAATGALSEIASPVNPVSVATSVWNISMNPDGRVLYLPSDDSIESLIVTKSEGYLAGKFGGTQLNSQPHDFLPHPTKPFGYAPLWGEAGEIGVYRLDPYSGLPSSADPPIIDSNALSDPEHGAFGGAGKFLYFDLIGLKSILGYEIDQNTGALTALDGFPYAVDDEVTMILADARGEFVYLFHESYISVHAVDADTGALRATGDKVDVQAGSGRATFVLGGGS